MFVLKYMAGYAETMTGGDSKADYDPHKHRVVPNPTTYAETMTHMLKGCLGAGVLAMPNAMLRLGIAAGIIGTILIAVFATYCMQLLINSQYVLCKKMKCGYLTYPKAMRLGVGGGPPCLRWSASLFYHGVDAILFFWQIGLCAIFAVLVAENFKVILNFYGQEASIRVVLCYCYIPILLVSLIKDLKLLAPFSAMSNLFTFLGLMLIFFYLIEDDVVLDEDKLKIKGIHEFPVFIGITLFALQAPGVMLALEYNMANPKQFTGLFGLFSIGMAIITVIYTALGVFGYLRFGAECKAAITLNLPESDKKAQVSVLSLGIAIFLSYPLQNVVAWQIAWRKSKKKFGESRAADFVLRFLCGSVPVALGLAAPTLGPFISLFGALCLSLVAVMFPAVLHLSVNYPDNYGCCHYKLLSQLC